MSEISDAVAERVGADPELTEEVEQEMQMRLAREALETAESVDSILEKAVTGDLETEDTSGLPDPYFAPLLEPGKRLELTYESGRADAGEQQKDVEVVSSRSFVGAEGFQHWDVHLRDLDRNESDQMQVEFLVDNGDVVHTAVYGYTSSKGKARDYGRRLGRSARLSEPSVDDGEPEEDDGDEDDTEDEGASTGDLMEDARNVVRENGLETSDWPTFQSELRSLDWSQSDASDAWANLKEEGLIDEPKESVPPWEQEDDGDDEAEGEEAEDVDAPDEVWLVTSEGCPACQQAKERLSEWIPDPIQVRNVMEDDEIADLAAEGIIPAEAPQLIRVDGNELTLV